MSPTVSSSGDWLQDRMKDSLERRKIKGTLRRYDTMSNNKTTGRQLDFSSNDYLGLAHCSRQRAMVEAAYQQEVKASSCVLGATGSRLLSGDSTYAKALEEQLAYYHGGHEAAVLFNSGYDANLAVMSCLPVKVIIYDEYSHNSIRTGLQLLAQQRGVVKQFAFEHNSVKDLQQKLEAHQKQQRNGILIVVESVYSMDGDIAPLKEILELASQYNAKVVVDEAHGLGVFGRRGMGVLTNGNLQLSPALAAIVYTFGKGAGCHGAVVCGSQILQSYLWNYARPLVYSTALPLHSLITISCSYETMRKEAQDRQAILEELRQDFCHLVHKDILVPHGGKKLLQLLPSTTPIQALLIQDNRQDNRQANNNQICAIFCHWVWEHSEGTLKLYPIRSPTVPQGTERIRIILHAHNTKEEVHRLVHYMRRALITMGYIRGGDDQPPSRL